MIAGKRDTMQKSLKTTNTILYCKEWEETVRFYRDRLQLPVNFSTDWFVEFHLTDSSRLSLADEKRSSIKSGGGRGITMALEVDDIETTYRSADKIGLRPSTIRKHPWNARVFYFFDPEGHRIEIWQNTASSGTARPNLNQG